MLNVCSLRVNYENILPAAYWESLLQQLKAHMARMQVRERHQEQLRRKLYRLKQQVSTLVYISADCTLWCHHNLIFFATLSTFFLLFCSKASRRPNRCSRFSDSQTAQPRTHPRHLPPALSRNRRPPAKTHSHPRRLRSRPKRLRQMTQNLARRKLLSVVMTPIVMTMTMNLCSQKLI